MNTKEGRLNDVMCESDDMMFQVILRRMDGSVNFFRPWESYKNGFGNKEGEHWLGECFCDVCGPKKANREIINNQRHIKLRHLIRTRNINQDHIIVDYILYMCFELLNQIHVFNRHREHSSADAQTGV